MRTQFDQRCLCRGDTLVGVWHVFHQLIGALRRSDLGYVSFRPLSSDQHGVCSPDCEIDAWSATLLAG